LDDRRLPRYARWATSSLDAGLIRAGVAVNYRAVAAPQTAR
jgi:hypothetical protein